MTIRIVTMTKGPIDRKLLQRVRSESEQNERLLGRVITTALSTCGTLVGWMVLSHATQATPAQANVVDATAEIAAAEEFTMRIDAMPNPTMVPIQIDFAPIPTLPTLPELLPVPTLMPYVAQPMSADVAPMQNNDSAPVVAAAPADSGVASAPAPVSDMPVLRVVAQPTPPVIKVVPKPAAPQPANQRPSAGGNSGGSN
jgi:hypothetical protein